MAAPTMPCKQGFKNPGYMAELKKYNPKSKLEKVMIGTGSIMPAPQQNQNPKNQVVQGGKSNGKASSGNGDVMSGPKGFGRY